MKLVVLGLVIYAFFNAVVASWIFIAISFLLITWIFLANRDKVEVTNKKKYNEVEIEMIETYHLFFRYPTMTRMLSRTFSAIQMATYVLMVLLLFKGLIVQFFLVAVIYFFSQQYAVILNPQFFHHDNIEHNRIKDDRQRLIVKMKMYAIDSALEKMYMPKEKKNNGQKRKKQN